MKQIGIIVTSRNIYPHYKSCFFDFITDYYYFNDNPLGESSGY